MSAGTPVAERWWLDRRYLLAGALVLWGIWAVESLRKGGLIWPWPLLPLAIWAVALYVVSRRSARRAKPPHG